MTEDQYQSIKEESIKESIKESIRRVLVNPRYKVVYGIYDIF